MPLGFQSKVHCFSDQLNAASRDVSGGKGGKIPFNYSLPGSLLNFRPSENSSKHTKQATEN